MDRFQNKWDNPLFNELVVESESYESENEHNNSLSSSSTRSNSGRQFANWNDESCTSSLSGSQGPKPKSVSKQMKINHTRGGDVKGGIYKGVRSQVLRAIADIKNDLSDSKARARKLREELDIEEQRRKELSKVLKEILPEPKNFQRPKDFQQRRENSIERWKISKCLTEEALNYFDECISLSTFDGFDLSSSDESPHSLTPPSPSTAGSRFWPPTSSSASTHDCINIHLNNDKEVQCTFNCKSSDLGTSSSGEDLIDTLPTSSRPSKKSHFTFGQESTRSGLIHQGLQSYMKMFEKEIQKDGGEPKNYDEHEYAQQLRAETLLFERVILKNRIESGVLHLCDTKSLV